MAEPLEPYGKAASAVAHDPVAGRQTAVLQAASKANNGRDSTENEMLRKRGRSSDYSNSPETSIQLLDERKKTKTN